MAVTSRHLALVAGLALLGVSVTVTPASAQFMQLFGFPSAEPPPPLPPEAIAARLARFNYKLTRLRRGPQGYIADAIDPSGRPVRLVMDPIDGALLQRTVLGPPPEAQPGAAPPGGAAPPAERQSRPPRREGQSAQTAPARENTSKPSPAEPSVVQPAAPAPAPAKPAEPFVPKAGPGYSHGVPVNPLE